MSSARRIGALAAHLPPATATPAAAVAPTMYLNTGAAMPIVGLGTFQATEPGEVLTAVKAAVNSGYRLIDCAAGYGNQVGPHAPHTQHPGNNGPHATDRRQRPGTDGPGQVVPHNFEGSLLKERLLRQPDRGRPSDQGADC